MENLSNKQQILDFENEKKQGDIDFVNDANEQVEKWEDFAKVLKPNEACWGLFKFSCTTKDGANRSKLLLVQWIPSDADKRDKRSYASMTTTKVKASLAGIHTTIQARGVADLDFDTALQRATRFERDEIIPRGIRGETTTTTRKNKNKIISTFISFSLEQRIH
jgi:hypothetical protein